MAVAPPEGFPRMAPQARPEVESLQGYSAPLEGRRGLLRLDFNENTLGPSPKVVEAIRAIPAEHYAIYPEYDGLREAVVASLGPSGQHLHPTQIGLFNGVDEALHAIFHAFGRPGDRLLTTAPTFGYYAPCARMQGMAIEAIPYRQPCFSFPLEEIHAALNAPDAPGLPVGPRLLMICNPNNPTGTRLAPARLLDLADAAPRTLVVVDELYEAFSGDSVLPLLEERAAAGGWPDAFHRHPNLVVLRSLSKTAGLAGLRIGFAIGHRDVVERLGRVSGPYDVNSFAVRAATAALADVAYVATYVEAVIEAKEWLSSELAQAGVRHHVDGGNYLLIWPTTPVEEMDQRLREAGILVRSMAGKPLIDGSMRVSIGTREQMERFWTAFQAIEAGALAPLG
ncbi:MAG: histidinol-phosphate transaminase [Cyanobacteriota bacterium]|nr:histidinol-phosphate transaminase [Cyanobacteriota bacterium]